MNPECTFRQLHHTPAHSFVSYIFFLVSYTPRSFDAHELGCDLWGWRSCRWERRRQRTSSSNCQRTLEGTTLLLMMLGARLVLGAGCTATGRTAAGLILDSGIANDVEWPATAAAVTICVDCCC